MILVALNVRWQLGAATALLLLLTAVSGCAFRWRGQEVVAVDPAADVWIHHPETVPPVAVPAVPHTP